MKSEIEPIFFEQFGYAFIEAVIEKNPYLTLREKLLFCSTAKDLLVFERAILEKELPQATKDLLKLWMIFFNSSFERALPQLTILQTNMAFLFNVTDRLKSKKMEAPLLAGFPHASSTYLLDSPSAFIRWIEESVFEKLYTALRDTTCWIDENTLEQVQPLELKTFLTKRLHNIATIKKSKEASSSNNKQQVILEFLSITIAINHYRDKVLSERLSTFLASAAIEREEYHWFRFIKRLHPPLSTLDMLNTKTDFIQSKIDDQLALLHSQTHNLYLIGNATVILLLGMWIVFEVFSRVRETKNPNDPHLFSDTIEDTISMGGIITSLVYLIYKAGTFKVKSCCSRYEEHKTAVNEINTFNQYRATLQKVKTLGIRFFKVPEKKPTDLEVSIDIENINNNEEGLLLIENN